MMSPQQNDRTGWIGIPSVPPERAAQAFVAFYLAIAAAIAIDILLITYNHQPETWQLTAERVFDDGGQIVAWALAATWPLMEAMRMVFATIFEKRTYQRGKDDANRLWREWLRRREQAEERGETFDEPPPDISRSNPGKPA
ncbi:MAG: hypothetical protein OXL37_06455 [Chloroflexota bacterium]|nr:hypothetical protein [Chloroflexota bacterium]MDE2959880.1 hypothetical protein [Chloroflexota bacterium]